MDVFIPKEITRHSPSELKIIWNDDQVSIHELRNLRYSCQCALCRHEVTGEKLIKLEDIPSDINVSKVEIVGNYGLTFIWTDNHYTGIYSYDYLRGLKTLLVQEDSPE